MPLRQAGYLFRRMQQIAVAFFVEECRAYDLTPVHMPHWSRSAPIPASMPRGFRRDRLRPFDARQRHRALETKLLIERKPSREDKAG